MAKRVKLYKDGNSIEVWDNNIDKFLANGYKLEAEKKSTKKKKVDEDKQEGVNEWQHMSEQADL
jgi:hypothetical protein|tara:strand:- start:1518 stop:1709 length:192 start_codon:yes stop_codon:yes gene_type:complete